MGRRRTIILTPNGALCRLLLEGLWVSIVYEIRGSLLVVSCFSLWVLALHFTQVEGLLCLLIFTFAAILTCAPALVIYMDWPIIRGLHWSTWPQNEPCPFLWKDP